ncbi:GNAT family N-acetyltransferase [Couchioplanes caeruleus]|uniref:GNAT family N-acetyltransferase n=1 Tax=Couchioplanes caeruleus TaxID=56438 RepID=UPI00201C3031|nr:GNAT family N-acetyltransferase [Couchioplanes caeruleus]UQU64201.1 GNAT family N-acetyltransferase [Couchioplanes caeruleus]
MVWHITKDVDDFLDRAGGFLRARPVENTVLLTIADTVRVHGPGAYGAEAPVFGWREGEEAAFLRTPPREALLSAMSPEAAAELAGVLCEAGLPGVIAPDATAEAFAGEWERLTGSGSRVHKKQRLYRLGTLVPPTPPAKGSARVAGGADRELLVDWMAAFYRDVGEEPHQVEEFIDDKLAHDGMLVWELDGRPVSMGGVTRPEAAMVRIQAVYTPREHRGHGFAGAVTTALSQAALDAGISHVLLFTDLANPTSNALYQRLGYTPLEDRSMVEFIA